MITEFAFTPSIFDEQAHDDKEAWRDHLRELGSHMFPRVAAWPVVVSDLYEGSWNSIAARTIKSIKDDKARRLCEGILQNMRRTLVHRPACGDWPEEDVGWAREAIKSNETESIDRIVANSKVKALLSSECSLIRSLEEVEEGGFWRGIASDASPEMIIDEQVHLLHKLCLHSQWIALINPYGSGNESDFMLELVKDIFHRPVGYVPVEFELHVQAPVEQDDVQRREKTQRVASDVARRLQPLLAVDQRVEMYFRPKFLDRFLLAGTYAKDSDGHRRKSPRWGVSMSHVARSSSSSMERTEWKLLRREQLDRWFRKFVDGVSVKEQPVVITAKGVE